MASSNSTLPLLQVGQAGKEAQINSLMLAGSPVKLFGLDLQGSIGLTWRMFGGRFRGLTLADQAVTLTASATNFIEANATTGVVSRNTVGFTVGAVALYTVVAGASGPTSWTDQREVYGVLGDLAGFAQLNQSNVWTRAQGTAPVAATGSGALTVDLSASNTHRIALTGNVTLTLNNPAAGFVYTLQFKQDATGGRVVTWPASLRWPGATAGVLSTGANAVDMLSLFYDGVDARFNAVLTKGFA